MRIVVSEKKRRRKKFKLKHLTKQQTTKRIVFDHLKRGDTAAAVTFNFGSIYRCFVHDIICLLLLPVVMPNACPCVG